jgi:hypothetical protein
MMMMILTYGQTQLTGVEAARMAVHSAVYLLKILELDSYQFEVAKLVYPDSYFVDGFNVIHVVHVVIIRHSVGNAITRYLRWSWPINTPWISNPFFKDYECCRYINSGWWFGTLFIFPNGWDDDPI